MRKLPLSIVSSYELTIFYSFTTVIPTFFNLFHFVLAAESVSSLPVTMSTDLVLSRGCRHNDWWAMPQTSVEFCRRCRVSIIYAASRPSKDVYAEVQV